MHQISFLRFLSLLFLFSLVLPAGSLSIPRNVRFERAIPGKISETTIYSIVQDRLGFIWFATRDGLWKFDGHTTTEYRYNPGDTTSISSSFIRNLFTDSDGNLWIATSGGGLNKYVAEYDYFIRFIHDKENPESLSHNDVLSVYQDKDGAIWVFTEDGFNRMDQQTGNFKRYYLEDDPRPGTLNRAFLTALEDSRGNFWVGSYFRGLFLFDKSTGDYKEFDFTRFSSDFGPLDPINLWYLYEDRKGNLWIATHNQGLFRYNPESDKMLHFHMQSGRGFRLSSNVVYNILEDNAGSIWIGTERGLNIFDPVSEQITQFFYSLEDPSSISNNAVWALMEDKSGTIWLGGWEGFADKWDRKSKRFEPRLSKSILLPDPLHYNSMIRDSRGRLIVGTNSGLMVFSNYDKLRDMGRISVPDDYPHFFRGNYVSAVTEDNSGNIWVATNQGLRRFSDKPAAYRTYTARDDDNSLRSGFITALLRDSRNTIWVGTQHGLHQYVRDEDNFLRYPIYPNIAGSISHRYVTSIHEDRNGIIWVGTHFGFNRLNQATGSFSAFQHQHNNPSSISNGIVNAIYHDSRGLLWVGTSAGLSCASDYSGYFRSFTIEEGLPANNISAMYEDEDGYLWVATTGGLARMEISVPSQNHPRVKLDSLTVTFWNFGINDGLADVSFKRGAVTRLPDGEVLFGGTHGISSFYPDSISGNSFIPPVVFTDLKVHNRSVRPQKGSQLLEKHIAWVDGIRLNYKQSVVTFDFVALGFTNSDKNKYAYIMKGFDKDWTHAGNRRTATYTNLNPGKYFFMVKASNNDGVWNENAAMLEVTVLPPWWKTWYAFFIYVFLLSGTVFLFASLALAKQKVEGRLRLQKLESEKINELNYFKSVFFTNISHEFRTPLTLIIGPLSDILKSEELGDGLRNQVKLIQKNALRLLRLINQLLDISKVEAGHIKLKVGKSNITEFVSSVFDAFRIKAEKDNITYRFYTSHDDINCYFDGDKVEKILYNLLSNAFKHTPPNGKIDVLLLKKKEENNKKYIELIVHDTGPGIPPEKQKKIFERYFVLSESQSPWQSSTGIGLSLANQLALVHKGKIELESSEGKGSRFMVKLPVYKQAYSADEIVTDLPVLSSEMDQVRMMVDYESSAIQPVASPGKHLPLALLVEDNRDVRDYVKERISHQYNVITSENGEDGFSKAIENIPDIIISDVMMPVMDGFEMCKRLKSDEKTSHIPIILLTAKVADESRVEGYETGADGYIPKPFQMSRLLARMRNLIDSRNKLREIFGKRLSLEPGEVSLNSVDEVFVQKAIDIIEKNISEPDFNVEMMCDKIGMSRSQAFRKFKGITDLSPVEFIRMIRIKRAAQLLEQRCGNISEVAYMVGFSDIDYFRKCFKEQFGVTPSKFIEKVNI